MAFGLCRQTECTSPVVKVYSTVITTCIKHARFKQYTTNTTLHGLPSVAFGSDVPRSYYFKSAIRRYFASVPQPSCALYVVCELYEPRSTIKSTDCRMCLGGTFYFVSYTAFRTRTCMGLWVLRQLYESCTRYQVLLILVLNFCYYYTGTELLFEYWYSNQWRNFSFP